MRAAAIFAAAVLMVSTTAFAQVEVPPIQSVPEATESTPATQDVPATEQAPDGTFVQQTQTSDDPVICRTTAATGTRLSRRTTRICRTRSEWEEAEGRASRELQRAGQTAVVRNN